MTPLNDGIIRGANDGGTAPALPPEVVAKSLPIWLVWSNEHVAWWGPNRRGYYVALSSAGRYTYADAVDICNGRDAKWPPNGTDKEWPEGNPPEVIVPAPEWATAIARALGGDGEPVAWQIVDVKDGPTAYVGVTEDAAWARMEKATGCSRAEWAKERHARPLYEHPASDASARVDEVHRALGKPGRVDDDGCCTGCGRSVQPSPCCPDFPVWPGPCRSCYAYDADADTVDAAARALAKAAIDARADEAVTGIIVPEAEWDALLAALNATKGGPDAR